MKNKAALPQPKAVHEALTPTLFSRSSVQTLAIASSIFLTAFGLGRLLRATETSWIEPPASISQELDPTLAQVASLGHVAAVVDAILIRSLGDPAYDRVARGTHPPLYYELKLATSLDPSFTGLYWYGSLILAVVRKDGPGGDEILERAHRRIVMGEFGGEFGRRAWFMEVLRATNALFELQDLPKAMAAFEYASTLPGAPPYLKSLSARLGTAEGRFEVARRSLASMIQSAADDQMKAELERRLAEFTVSERLYTIHEQFKRWLQGRQASSALFDRFRGPAGYADLRWDAGTERVETLSPREAIPGFY